MARGKTQKRIVAIAGLVLLLVGLLALAFWKELAASYHVHRLTREPAYLAEILSSPEGSPQAIAIRQFIAGPAGRQALFELVFKEMKRQQPLSPPFPHEYRIFWGNPRQLEVDPFLYSGSAPPGTPANSTQKRPEPQGVFPRAWDLLASLGTQSFRWSAFPSMDFGTAAFSRRCATTTSPTSPSAGDMLHFDVELWALKENVGSGPFSVTSHFRDSMAAADGGLVCIARMSLESQGLASFPADVEARFRADAVSVYPYGLPVPAFRPDVALEVLEALRQKNLAVVVVDWFEYRDEAHWGSKEGVVCLRDLEGEVSAELLAQTHERARRAVEERRPFAETVRVRFFVREPRGRKLPEMKPESKQRN